MIIFKRNLVKLVLCLVTSLAFVYTCSTSATGSDDGNTGGDDTTPDTTAPTFGSSVPTNNGSLRGDANITITFSENIQAGTGNITIGDSISINIATDTTQFTILGSVLTINPSSNLTAGDYTLTLPAGVVKDTAGNPNAEITFNFTVDTTAPSSVSRVLVVNGDADGNIVITFDEEIRAGTGNITIGDSISIAIADSQIDISDRVLTINPNSDLIDLTTYLLTLPAGVVKDTAGNPNSEIRVNITVPDRTAPDDVSSVPAMNGTLPANGNIAVTFNEEIQAGTGIITIGDSISIDIATDTTQVTILNSVLTIDPSSDLTAGDYTLTIPRTAVQDLAGNSLDEDFTLTFTATAAVTFGMATYSFNTHNTEASSTNVGSVMTDGLSDYSLTSCTGFEIDSMGMIATSAANPTAGTTNCMVGATIKGGTTMVTANVNINVAATCTGTMLPDNDDGMDSSETLDLGPTENADGSGNACDRWQITITHPAGSGNLTDQVRQYRLRGIQPTTSYRLSVNLMAGANYPTGGTTSVCHRATIHTTSNKCTSTTRLDIFSAINTGNANSDFTSGTGTNYFVNLEQILQHSVVTVTLEPR